MQAEPVTSATLSEIQIRPAERHEEPRYKEQMAAHHYLGDLAKIGETLWYVATWRDQWVALLSISAAALKCGVRDRWIGWDSTSQYGRLKLIANNSRFLILPEWHHPNVGSRVLSLMQRRLVTDWQARFGHPVLLLETFVDPVRFHGGVYRASNWAKLGLTQGYRRTRTGYSAAHHAPKLVFVYPLCRNPQALLTQADRAQLQLTGKPNIMLTADQMRILPDFFNAIPDPRSRSGRRHRLSMVLSIAAAATLCGMKGYKAMAGWAQDLGDKARERLGCRRVDGCYVVPSEFVIRDVLIRVEPGVLDHALQQWNEIFGAKDQRLAVDGKTMCNAINAKGQQTHIMSAVGHHSGICYTQKKSVLCP
jgi:hypothetical protein